MSVLSMPQSGNGSVEAAITSRMILSDLQTQVTAVYPVPEKVYQAYCEEYRQSTRMKSCLIQASQPWHCELVSFLRWLTDDATNHKHSSLPNTTCHLGWQVLHSSLTQVGLLHLTGG